MQKPIQVRNLYQGWPQPLQREREIRSIMPLFDHAPIRSSFFIYKYQIIFAEAKTFFNFFDTFGPMLSKLSLLHLLPIFKKTKKLHAVYTVSKTFGRGATFENKATTADVY